MFFGSCYWLKIYEKDEVVVEFYYLFNLIVFYLEIVVIFIGLLFIFMGINL